jgi:hypothetical protein
MLRHLGRSLCFAVAVIVNAAAAVAAPYTIDYFVSGGAAGPPYIFRPMTLSGATFSLTETAIIALPKFNPSLGTLTSVTLNLYSESHDTPAATNRGPEQTARLRYHSVNRLTSNDGVFGPTGLDLTLFDVSRTYQSRQLVCCERTWLFSDIYRGGTLFTATDPALLQVQVNSHYC